VANFAKFDLDLCSRFLEDGARLSSVRNDPFLLIGLKYRRPTLVRPDSQLLNWLVRLLQMRLSSGEADLVGKADSLLGPPQPRPLRLPRGPTPAHSHPNRDIQALFPTAGKPSKANRYQSWAMRPSEAGRRTTGFAGRLLSTRFSSDGRKYARHTTKNVELASYRQAESCSRSSEVGR
jgi:hypothetical protein